MLFVLIASALAIVVAVLGLSICRIAALSDRNSSLALAEWLATRDLDDLQVVAADRSGAQLRFDPLGLGEASRAAG